MRVRASSSDSSSWPHETDSIARNSSDQLKQRLTCHLWTTADNVLAAHGGGNRASGFGVLGLRV